MVARNKRCADCCPMCKHECRLQTRHVGMLHECGAHFWGTKRQLKQQGRERLKLDDLSTFTEELYR